MTSAITREIFPDSSVVALWAPASAAAAVLDCLRELNAARALIVCGENVGRSALVQSLLAQSSEGLAISVFSSVESDPSDATARAGGLVARDFGAEAIVAIGGGSSMDAGKAIAVEATLPGWIVSQDRPGQPTTLEHTPLPVIAVPTTAGTGSEVTSVSVITFVEKQYKLVLSHPAMFARFAVMDSTLLASAPRSVRMSAGMDALTHAVESYVSKQATADTRARAFDAISGIGRFLRRAVNDAADAQALDGMQRAAFIAGLAFAKTRLGIVHAMALPLSALFHVPHGTANAILLPHGMRFNHLADATGFAEIARALGVDTAALSPEDAALAAVEAVAALAADVQAPARMSDVGVVRDFIPRMADDAMKSAHLKVNPREVGLDDILAVYADAF